MADKILGLVGPGTGPYISTKVLGGRPVARIKGLLKGAVMVECAQTSRGDTALFVRIENDGVHELRAAPFMRVTCEDGNPHMICTLIARSEDALPKS